MFMIDPRDLGDLNAVDGTKLICDVIRCEATALGVAAKRVVISSKTTVKDGGIDAKVEDAPEGGSLLVKGDSYIQVKTGATFKPWRLGDLKKELFGNSKAKPAKSRLGAEVKRCLQKKGYYALVSLGHDLLPTQHSDAVEHLKALFAECGYKNAKVEVLGQGQVVGQMEHFPSLCLNFNGLGGTSFQSIDSWRANADMQTTLVLAEIQSKFIEDIRQAWRGAEFQHVRVIGEPGIGKTRLILEAASADDLRAPTIYVPHAEDFQNSSLFNELLKPDRAYTVSLVIDECEERERASIWNTLKGRPRIKLVTIDHGPETSSDTSMQVLNCPPLPNEQIGAILSTYIGHRADVSNWAEWCEGSPRVAHAVGENLKHNPQDILKPPATVPIWDRFVVGHQNLDSRSAEEHRLVLRHIALFQRFGFEDPVSQEAQFISRLVAEADPGITWAKFQSIVRQHQGRRILQGRHTLFIVPKALHVYLWLSYWNEHGVGFDFERFLGRLPEGLIHWFLRLFIYAHAAPVAQGVVKKILTLPSGPFGRRDFLLSELGTRFLDYLAEADPPSTLSVIERTFGRWSLEDLKAWTTGRQDIVFALEKLAVWRDLFTRSATVLSRMALAENANFSNNSKGTFVGLFSMGPEWAATEATPEIRFAILSQLLKSTDPAQRSLGLEVCGQWMSPIGGSRIVGAEYQGLRPTVSFWRPQTYGEWYSCWLKAWQFLRSEVKTWNEAERRIGLTQLMDSGATLLPYVSMADEVMETLEELADDPAVDKAHLIEVVISLNRFRNQKLPKGIRPRLRKLDKKLAGTSFWDRFSRFVLFTNWEEDYVSEGDGTKPDSRSAARVESLAKEALRDRSLFNQHLPGFITVEGHRLPQFGYQIAKHAETASLDDQIFTTLERHAQSAKSDFLGGYLSAVREADFSRWEAILLRILASAELRVVGVNASFRSGLSERVVRCMLALYRDGSIHARAFSRLGFDAQGSGVPASLVNETIEAMVQRGEEADLLACIELLDRYYCQGDSDMALPREIAFLALRATLSVDSRRNSMREYHWHRVARKYRETYPEKDMDLFAEMLKRVRFLSRMGNKNEPVEIADQISKAHPAEAWRLISSAIEKDTRGAFDIVRWLGDGGFEDRPTLGAIRSLDPNDIVTWAAEAPDQRVRLLMPALPKTLDPNGGGLLTQRFIEVFGGSERIREAIAMEFIHSGGWAGHRSEYLSRKRDKARYWLSEIKSPQAQDWLRRYIETLGEEIERSKMEEERE